MAWEWLNKYLKGQSIRSSSLDDEPIYRQTEGLFGKGGEYGTGGLLTNFQSNPAAMESLGKTFSNPLVLGSLKGMQLGSQGKNIMQAAPEAIISGVKDAYTIGKLKKIQKEKKAMEKLLASDEISDINKLLISAGKNPLPEKRGSFEKKVEYIANNSKFNKNEVIGILIKDKDKWSKKRFMSETFTRSVGTLGASGAKKAAEDAGKFWDLNFESSAPGSTVDLSTITLTKLGSEKYGSVNNIIKLMQDKFPDTSTKEIIAYLKKQNIIQ